MVSIIVKVSSSVICLNMQEIADGVCRYCVYVAVWSLDMVEAKFVPIFCKVVVECSCYFFRIGHSFFHYPQYNLVIYFDSYPYPMCHSLYYFCNY